MPKFVKLPIVVEAEKISDLIYLARENMSLLPSWVREAYEAGLLIFLHDTISISTLDGRMRAGMDSWLLRGVKGELYPCDGDVFAATYSKV